MFDLAPIGVSITRGPDHRLVYVNEAQRAIFGPRPLGKPLLQAFNDLAEAGYLLVLDQVMTTGKPEFLPQVPVTVNYPNAGRQERYFNLSFTPVFLDDGEPAVLNLIADVTETID
ncbi:MAG: PAS domain-containing protein, partial [Thermobifida fusca]|nr:PAS domain-containing protein [Thermobifida fusca]